MSDISMCLNEKCPLKETCYRFKANKGFYQFYSDFEFDSGCDDYWEIIDK